MLSVIGLSTVYFGSLIENCYGEKNMTGKCYMVQQIYLIVLVHDGSAKQVYNFTKLIVSGMFLKHAKRL